MHLQNDFDDNHGDEGNDNIIVIIMTVRNSSDDTNTNVGIRYSIHRMMNFRFQPEILSINLLWSLSIPLLKEIFDSSLSPSTAILSENFRSMGHLCTKA